MANGDPLTLGALNSASRPTRLTTTANSGGDNVAAVIVRRVGTPAGSAALIARHDSLGTTSKTGVIGHASRGGTGVLGTADALGPNLLGPETGVRGEAQTTGVLGIASTGMLIEDGEIVVAATGVAGVCSQGVGVAGSSVSGFGVVGDSRDGVGVAGRARGVNPGVVGRSDRSIGVQGGSQTGVGVQGLSTSSFGVEGISAKFTGVVGRSTVSAGIAGESVDHAGGYCVSSKYFGLLAKSDEDIGVVGMSKDGDAGVLGQSKTRGVWGWSQAGVGVHGSAPNGIGVRGSAPSTIAVEGITSSGFGMVGRSTTGVAVAGASTAGYAGYFQGPVLVNGNFLVTGAKSALVEHRDGSHRAMYCVESPESWFEDFGEAEIKGGVAVVKLDPDFAALVDTRGYQVFLTSYSDAQLYVSKRSRAGFEIRAGSLTDAGRAVRCGYRVVARRARVDAPRLKRVVLPELPGAPALEEARPKPPSLPRRLPVLERNRQRPKPVAIPGIRPPQRLGWDAREETRPSRARTAQSKRRR